MSDAKGPLSLQEMLTALKNVDGDAWGRYALSRDPLQGRIPEDAKSEMIHRSIDCGNKYAALILKQFGSVSPQKAAEQLNLDVQLCDGTMSEKRLLFAQFTPPNRIELMRGPLEKYRLVLENTAQNERGYLPEIETVRDILLGHEIFHYLEERDQATIYTRTEKIRLWHFLCFKNDSTIEALSEIAGMAFTKKLNNLVYSPFLLDVLLFFGYNSNKARDIFYHIKDVMAVQNEGTRNW